MKTGKWKFILLLSVLAVLYANVAAGIVFNIDSDSLCTGSTDNRIRVNIQGPCMFMSSIHVHILFDTTSFTIRHAQRTANLRYFEYFTYSEISEGIQINIYNDNNQFVWQCSGSIAEITLDVSDEIMPRDYNLVLGAVECRDEFGQTLPIITHDGIITAMDCSGCALSLSDTVFDFGKYYWGGFRYETVSLTNSGTTIGDIQITYEGCAKARTHLNRFILEPGFSRELAIYCSPNGPDPCEGMILLDGCGTAEIHVTCSGTYKDSVYFSISEGTVFHHSDENTITLDFENDTQIGALQTEVFFNTTCFAVTGIRKTERSCNLDIFNYSEIAGGIRICMTGLGHCIKPGIGPIATIVFRTDECIEKWHSWTPAYSLSGDALGRPMFCGETGGIVTVFECQRGDVDNSGVVNVIDVFWALRIVLDELANPTPRQLEVADCNDDGVIDVSDVIGIVNIVLGLGTCPP
jgi:hypothetical protein